MQTLALVRAEMTANPRFVIFLTVLSATSSAMVLAVINKAADLASTGGAGVRLAFIFLILVALFAVTQRMVTVLTATQVENMVDRLRGSVIEDIRLSDMQSLVEIGRSNAFGALTRDCQTISRSVPLLVVGAQQAVMLVFVAFYLAWLSLPAFAAISVFLAVSVWLHWQRMGDLREANERVDRAEDQLFDGLDGMLRGLKEIRLNETRADEVLGDLAAISRHTEQAKSATKRRWASEIVGIQLAFYALVGVMVFVVPMFTTGFHAEAMQATTAAMFMIGPIGTVVQAVPTVGDADRALVRLNMLKHRLRRGRTDTPEAPEPMAPPQDIVLSGLGYRYPEVKGDAGFYVGPLDARFRAGEITFITGGNGSGKSTMLRLLVGLVPPSGGTLSVDGQAVPEERMQAYRNTISAVFSDFHVFRHLYGIPPEALSRAGPLLARLELDHKVRIENGAFSTIALSAGQRKRLALVVADLEDKPVLVLDEWAADQDPHFRRLFYEDILPAYRAQGKVVICVTHDDRWFGVADQVLAMRDGRFVTEGEGPAG